MARYDKGECDFSTAKNLLRPYTDTVDLMALQSDGHDNDEIEELKRSLAQKAISKGLITEDDLVGLDLELPHEE